jgi:hypothetical protein
MLYLVAGIPPVASRVANPAVFVRHPAAQLTGIGRTGHHRLA